MLHLYCCWPRNARVDIVADTEKQCSKTVSQQAGECSRRDGEDLAEGFLPRCTVEPLKAEPEDIRSCAASSIRAAVQRPVGLETSEDVVECRSIEASCVEQTTIVNRVVHGSPCTGMSRLQG